MKPNNFSEYGLLAHVESLGLTDSIVGGLRVHYQLWIAPNLEEIRADIRGQLRYEIEGRIQSGDLWAWPILTCVAHVDGFKETETVSGEATKENGTWRGFKEFQACGDWMLLRAEAIEDLGKQVAATRMLKAWNQETDQPKPTHPEKSSIACMRRYHETSVNLHYIVVVYENRKRTRRWLEVSCGGQVVVYLTTKSVSKAKEWIDAVNNNGPR